MGFKRFSFKRNWTSRDSETGFATVENDETTVRADMQALHDEAKDGLNALMVELESSGAASSIGAKDHTGANKTVQQALDGIATELRNISEIKAENLGANNIALDKKGEAKLAEAYGLNSLVPTVHDALTVVASKLSSMLSSMLSKSGGTMTGHLSIAGNYRRITFLDDSSRTAFLEKHASDTGTFGMYNSSGDNRSALLLNPETALKKDLLLLSTKFGSELKSYNVLHTGNLDAPTGAVGAPPYAIARVATGTYTGTGTYGPSNANKLTFSFVPKLVIVEQNTVSGTDWFHLFAVQGNNRTFARYTASSSPALATPLTWSGKTLSWYGTESAQKQGNVKDVIYHYIAVG
jgi:hypothetical protein